MRTALYSLLFSLILFSFSTASASAQTAKMGMHILSIEEVHPVRLLLQEQGNEEGDWYYITIPFTLADSYIQL
ncbi:hypothetical protein KA012_03800 [Candidatus Woesebacteria bacterium]|nr:hypothetical protein [Candidatus Woesebacteria bacterium]